MASAARPEYVPSVASQVLGAFVGRAGIAAVIEFPTESSLWYTHAMTAGPAPTMVLLCGVLCAGFTALNLCRPAPAPRLADSLQNLAIGGAVLMVVWFAALLSFHQLLDGYAQGLSALREATTGVAHVREDLASMNRTAIDLQADVSGLLGTCYGLDELVRRSLGDEAVDSTHRLEAAVVGELLGYRSLISRLRPGVSLLSDLLHAASDRMSPWTGVLRYCFLTPVKLTAVASIGLFAVLSAHSVGGTVSETVDDVGLGRLASLFAMLVVLAAAASGAAFLGLGSAAGAFCSDVDASIVRLVGLVAEVHGAEVLMSRVADFYVFGRGTNALLTDLAEANSRAQAVVGLFADQKRLVGSLGLYCPDIMAMQVEGTAASLQRGTQRDAALLGEGRMYEQYARAVHQGFCGAPLEALGRLVLLQLILGLVCLPLVAALARPWIGQGAGKEPGRVGNYGPVAAGPGRPDTRLGAESALGTRSTASATSRAASPWAKSAAREASDAEYGRLDAATTIGGRPALETACEAGDVDFLREASRAGSPVSTWDYARAYGNYLYSSVRSSPPGLEAGSHHSLRAARVSQTAEDDEAFRASMSVGELPSSDPILAEFVPRKGSEKMSSAHQADRSWPAAKAEEPPPPFVSAAA